MKVVHQLQLMTKLDMLNVQSQAQVLLYPEIGKALQLLLDICMNT